MNEIITTLEEPVIDLWRKTHIDYTERLGEAHKSFNIEMCLTYGELIAPVQELNNPYERTCRNEWVEFGKFRCSECRTEVDAISTNTTQPMPIRYCPNCGYKVVDE